MAVFFSCLVVLTPLSSATYYIDWNAGADSNKGTSKTVPWKRCPGMRGFVGAYTHVAGDRFIFKGGTTWPNEALSFFITSNGTATARDYYGVDESWYSGEQYVEWVNGRGVRVRSFNWPVLDAQGKDIVDARNVIGSTGGTRNNIILVTGDYVTVEGLAARGVLINDNGAGGTPNPDAGTDHTLRVYGANYFRGEGLYLSDWVVATLYGGDVGGARQDASIDARLNNCRIWGPEKIDPQWIKAADGQHYGNAVDSFAAVTNCDIRRVVQGSWNNATFAYNTIWDGGRATDPATHENGINIYNGNAKVYGNVVHDWWGGTAIFVVPGWGTVKRDANGVVIDRNDGEQYVFNNVVWNTAATPISISESANAEISTTKAFIFNNTVRATTGIRMGDRTNPPLDVVDIRGNLIITESGPGIAVEPKDIPTLTVSGNVTMTSAQAAAAGMTEGNLFTPAKAIVGVTDAGPILSAFFKEDINGIPRDQSWSVGAHQFVGSTTPPNKPSQLVLVL